MVQPSVWKRGGGRGSILGTKGSMYLGGLGSRAEREVHNICREGAKKQNKKNRRREACSTHNWLSGG